MAQSDDEQEIETQPVSVGDRLRQAREGRGLSLEDVARQTRIPIRHLKSIEEENWDALPAATYSVGFTRSYGNAIGLDGSALAREVREQVGGARRQAPPPEYYEQADPARVPPRALALVAAAIGLVLVIVYLVWRSNLVSDQAPRPTAEAEVPVAEAPEPAPTPGQPPSPQAAAGQPVSLVATGEVWLRISEGGRTLVERTLAPGETLQVPVGAERPVLRVGAPESLRVRVGQTEIPQLGPAGRPVGDVSLRPEDLVARAQAPAPPPAGGQ